MRDEANTLYPYRLLMAPSAAPSPVSVPSARTGLTRAIGFWSGTSLLVGTIIGSGIFRTPASIALTVSDPRVILGLWVFFGIVTLCGALTLAELATMLPRTGGTYVYLRAGYGDCLAFVFGWIYLLIAIPSGIAASAVFFGELLMSLTGGPAFLGGWTVPAVAIAVITILSVVNIAGLSYGAAVQNLFTVVKVGALLAIIFGALLSGQGDFSRWTQPAADASGGGSAWDAVKLVMYTYNGWIYISLVAGEVKEPTVLLKRIILVGTTTIVLLYLGANLAYLYIVPLSAMPGTTVAKETVTLIAGPAVGTFVGFCILASVFGGLNGVILTKARVAYAQARDQLTFAFLGRVHPKRATPYVSIAIQGVCAVFLVMVLHDATRPLHLFDRLVACFALFEWLALFLAIGAVFILRRTKPDWARAYRTPGYPLVPLFFMTGTGLGIAAMLWSSWSAGEYAPWIGLLITAAGFPIYWVWRRTQAAQPPPVFPESA